MEANFSSLFKNNKLRFIFVGGKGGVGKTTSSSSIALGFAKTREKVLIISTDPAHNLADAFNQQFSHEPTQVQGTTNLWAMEVDPKKSFEQSNIEKSFSLETDSSSSLVDFVTNIPGIDEAIVVINLLKLAKDNQFDLVIFDTAPTGHTLKLLGYPAICQKLLEKVLSMKDKLSLVSNMLGSDIEKKIDAASEKAQQLKVDAEHLIEIMRNPDLTTFVGVCIPEFLSVYETERLVQELATHNIDISHIIVNQIVFPDDDCRKCWARFKMQSKYIEQIFDLYSDFHVVLMPLEEEEIRGIPKLEAYAQRLQITKTLPKKAE